MNTEILEKADSFDEVRINVFSKLLQNRIIFIDDLTMDQVAVDIMATLLLLDKENQEKITIFINSEGGDIRNIFTIYDAMQLTSSPLETICIGSVMREAVLLLAAGTKGHRVITKNADICLSQAMSPYMSYSDLTNTKISHDKTVKDNDTFLRELAKNTGKTFKILKKDTERQVFMTPTQAVKYGIADRVL